VTRLTPERPRATVNVHALLATAVNADGYREILGLQVSSAEDGAGWLAFFPDLVADRSPVL
jgi:putative transposase